MAREFDRDLRLLVLDQPTRGLDVGSIEFIHRQTIAKRDAGTAILLVSAELDEVHGAVRPHRGHVPRADRGDPRRRTADKNEIGLLMATGGRGAARSATRRGVGVTTDAGSRQPRRRSAPSELARLGRCAVPWSRSCWRSWSARVIILVSQLGRARPRVRPDAADRRPTPRSSRGRSGAQTAIVNTLRRRHAACPRRPGGRPGVQGRALQHRCAGPVPDRGARSVAVGVAAERASPASWRSRWRCWPALLAGAAWGFIPGFLKAVLGRPRGGHHDHAQLHRRRHHRVRLVSGPLRPARLSVADHRRRRQRRRCRSSSAGRGHIGILVALVAVLLVWLAPRTGRPSASRSGPWAPTGCRALRGHGAARCIIVLTMSLAGCSPGSAGAVEILGVTHHMTALRHDGRLRRHRRGAAGRAPSRSAIVFARCSSVPCAPARR